MLSDLFSVKTGLWTRISLHLVSFLFFFSWSQQFGKTLQDRRERGSGRVWASVHSVPARDGLAYARWVWYRTQFLLWILCSLLWFDSVSSNQSHALSFWGKLPPAVQTPFLPLHLQQCKRQTRGKCIIQRGCWYNSHFPLAVLRLTSCSLYNVCFYKEVCQPVHKTAHTNTDMCVYRHCCLSALRLVQWKKSLEARNCYEGLWKLAILRIIFVRVGASWKVFPRCGAVIIKVWVNRLMTDYDGVWVQHLFWLTRTQVRTSQ